AVKHRIIGAVLFGFGVLLLVIAVGLRVQVTPAVTGIPYDQERSTSVSVAKGATALQASPEGIKILQNVDLRSVTDIVPNPKVADTELPDTEKPDTEPVDSGADTE
ncbi:porin PorA family protein, partial [Klebsiella pneumoniae]|uniref:porin PorA family protein n=1 Tax=Klebsiella pneumoniae TaxID=573 RepID=UPI003A7FC99A